MTTPKWTPGPWAYTLEEDERGAYCDIHDHNIKLVAHCADETNARLIAAAPEMADWIQRNLHRGQSNDFDIGRALLARINGDDTDE